MLMGPSGLDVPSSHWQKIMCAGVYCWGSHINSPLQSPQQSFPHLFMYPELLYVGMMGDTGFQSIIHSSSKYLEPLHTLFQCEPLHWLYAHNTPDDKLANHMLA